MKRSTLALSCIAASFALSSVPAGAARAGGSAPAVRETIKLLSRGPIPNVRGKELISVEVLFPPGSSAPPHTHPAFVYAYVLSGRVVSAVGSDRPRTYRAGESWRERPGANHRVTRNPSTRLPAKLLALFIADAGTRDLVRPEGR
jgi:quercetin dioxygenase-like cupin family protein